MSASGPPELERSSSFARSFFQAGQGEESNYDAYEGAAAGAPVAAGNAPNEANGQAHGPGAGMRRQRSRRRVSQRASRSSGDNVMKAAAAAAAAADEGEGQGNEEGPLSGAERQTSWYTDALLQGGGEDLSAILQESSAAAQETHTDDDEVLEQYRIMAHVEANLRVKDNTGFDMAEYDKRRKLQPEPTKGEYYTGSKKPKAKLPEPRLLSGAMAMSAEEPPLPPPRVNARFVKQRAPKVAELCPGVVVRGQGNIPEGEHVVRCLGCKTQLRLNLMATLVNCPDCSTVSPASSTRH